jgi:Ca-activated chloride channel family protein
MPPSIQDHYEILGIPRSATPDEIKRAYLKAARRLHPDRNVLPGETELFLDVQRAYEVLSNPDRRALYDATLGEAPSKDRSALEIHLDYSRPSLVQLDEAQLLYTLVEVRPADPADQGSSVPLNLCLVVDRSTSMQGEKLDVAKAAAIQVIRMLRAHDLFGLVVFSDKAELLLPAAYRHDPNKAQSRMQAVRAFGATELFQGLRAGIDQLRAGLDPGRASHLILLTDGHTYGDEAECLKLAEEAAALNIGISALGVGTDWNDIFLDALAARTGGNSTYVARAGDIQNLLADKFAALALMVVEDVVLEQTPLPGVLLKNCFRIQPESGPIETGELMHMGPILHDQTLKVIFEFLIEPGAVTASPLTVLEGSIHAGPSTRLTHGPPLAIKLDRITTESPSVEAPPPAILAALSKLSLYRLEERARSETEAGEFEMATRHLRNLALLLESEGHHELSQTAVIEAEGIEKQNVLSRQGAKAIKYGTRALLRAETGRSG